MRCARSFDRPSAAVARPPRRLEQPAASEAAASPHRQPRAAGPHRGTARRSDNADRVDHGARPAASLPLRHPDSRDRCAENVRRIRRGLRRPEGTRGRRPHSPRLLCEWRRRDAVCAARRARPASIAQGRARGTEVVVCWQHRSRQSMRHDPAVAGRGTGPRTSGADTISRFARSDGQRHACGIHQPGSASTTRVPARRRTGAGVDRARLRRRWRGSGCLCTKSTASPRQRTPPGAVSRRGRIQPFSDGLPDPSRRPGTWRVVHDVLECGQTPPRTR